MCLITTTVNDYIISPCGLQEITALSNLILISFQEMPHGNGIVREKKDRDDVITPILTLFKALISGEQRNTVSYQPFLLASRSASASLRERFILPWLSISMTFTTISSPTLTMSSTLSTRCLSSLEM